MTDQLNTQRTPIIAIVGGFMAGATVLGIIIVLGLALIGAMSSKSDISMTEALGKAIGEIEAGHAQAQMMAEADFKHRMALADAEVQRVTAYYTSFYQAVGVAAQQAAQWEGQLINQQSATVSNNNFVETLGSNVLSIGCIGTAFNPSDPTAAQLCDAKENLERGMVDDFTELPEYRPRYVEDVLTDFPHPSMVGSPEYKRIRAEFAGAYNDDE